VVWREALRMGDQPTAAEDHAPDLNRTPRIKCSVVLVVIIVLVLLALIDGLALWL